MICIPLDFLDHRLENNKISVIRSVKTPFHCRLQSYDVHVLAHLPKSTLVDLILVSCG